MKSRPRRNSSVVMRLLLLHFAALVMLSASPRESSAQLSGTWTGSLDATNSAMFGGPPSCFYDQQFTNATLLLTLGGAGIANAEVTVTSTERPVQPCADLPGSPTLHRYVLDSWSADGAGGTINFRQVSGNPGVSLVFNGTLRPDRRIEGTLVWRRIDQTPPLAWTIAAQIVLDNPASALTAPSGLDAQVNDFAVTLSWGAVSGATNYILQVGSAQGASNLLNVTVPQNQISGVAPVGTYYWRVLATNGAVSSLPSSPEGRFVVGCSPLSAPQNLTQSVDGNIVTLQWTGDAADYIVEAGSQSGLSNLYNAATGSAATQLSVPAPLGTYYVRIRARNACDVSAPSNEQVVVVDGSCSLTLTPATVTSGANGGPFSTVLSTGPTCSWTASANQSWLQLTGPIEGVGPATLTGNITANSGPPRSGSVTVGRASLSVTQAGVDAACNYDVSPATENLDRNSTQREIAISTTSNCSWEATSNFPWITFDSPSSGHGSATLRYRVSANGAGSRTGHITVVGSGAAPPVSYVTTVNQAGLECTYEVTPLSVSVGAAATSFPIAVSAPNGCSWSAQALSGFISLSSGGNGNGNGSAQFNVQENAGGTRTGTVQISWTGGHRNVPITQSGMSYTASIASSGNCNVHTTCATCQLTVSTNMPSPSTYAWNLAEGTHSGTSQPVTKTATISAPNWSAYHEAACKVAGGQIPVEVSVTVTNAAGATASGSGNVSVFRT